MAIHVPDARQDPCGGKNASNSAFRSRRLPLPQDNRLRRADSDREPLAAFGTASIEDGAPVTGAHPFPKTMRAFALHDGRLISAFGSHGDSSNLRRRRESIQLARALPNGCFARRETAKRKALY
ncbi:putative hydrolase of the metallo-beta-lactamase superfamily [Burkholderiales bacterium GJ-E10]|nr:putative hydrolase of the metallo-beta-lactamase superfamily [Burkholderiales bacterium GJ-E10]